MQVSAGKYRGFQRLGDDRGLLKMIAIDQRNPILGPIMKIRGTSAAPYQDVADVKDLLAKYLSPKSSAMLLDPIFSFPRSLPLVGSRPGLILAYENAKLEETPHGSKSSPIPGWSVEKARLAGADAVKVLVWYRADAPDAIRKHQQAFVRAAGEACRGADLVNLTEILIYPLPGEDPAFVRQNRARLVQAALDDFLDPAFNIDIYKLEPPSGLADVADPDGPGAADIQVLYDKLAANLPRPWVLLSAGATAEDFRRSLVYAYRAGASGYLCGRAIWKSAFDRFPDLAAIAATLQSVALPYLDEINALTDRSATPWHAHSSFAGDISFLHAGEDFPASYAA